MAVEAAGPLGESPNQEEHRQDQLEQQSVAAAQQYPLSRQSSMLSLTLDEIQNTILEPGKSFGSMNMDEFLANVWTAEEGTAVADEAGAGSSGFNDRRSSGGPNATANDELPPPTSLYREGSLSIPAPLCRKTVDEVWSEIQRDQQQYERLQYQSSANTPHEPTFGEMTLEDFLIKAGVVPEGGCSPCSMPPHLNQFSLPNHHQQNQNQYGLPGSSVMAKERYGDQQTDPRAITTDGAGHTYQQQRGQGVVGNDYGGGGDGFGYAVGGGIGDGPFGVASPVSPISSDGLGCCGQVDYSETGRQWQAAVVGGSTKGSGEAGAAGDVGGSAVGCRKRVLGGPVEKVTERRHRRMIKNRESAARSRARKQAYTVVLEAELNQLKGENAGLREELRRLTAHRRQMLVESMAARSQRNLQRNAKRLRRRHSCAW